MDINQVQKFLRDFAEHRDWEQFHTPKNLVMALTGEVGELTELFQWLSPEESSRLLEDEQKRRDVEEELADILQYIVRLADVLDVDLEQALWAKLRKNEERYPVDKARSNALKYTEFENGLGE